LQAIYYRDPSHLSDLTKILTKNRTQDIIFSPEHPEPFWTPTQLWPNVVRSIRVWARITSAVCARSQTLSPRWGLVGGLRRSRKPSDQIALSFNSFSGYRGSRHSIPPLTSVVDADLSMV
jgi:hypothetical protein